MSFDPSNESIAWRIALLSWSLISWSSHLSSAWEIKRGISSLKTLSSSRFFFSEGKSRLNTFRNKSSIESDGVARLPTVCINLNDIFLNLFSTDPKVLTTTFVEFISSR